ncbi:voltage-gated potassium channel [Sinomonas cellulolyticus]|uniref:Potassium channel family protein n=1 Tax=Sinomonas cellulolyticus TaxID=2801916 RepID=A0ABS1JYU9_9MICC|nr:MULTISPECIES: potassium channel family protein [Sinomonas]MBL0704566.1 potassium channel family protein [Sinomonas cellulolyticus]GHG49381.1 voltage-gated potassium channel [Sinomonas sp. KCTC 49339]
MSQERWRRLTEWPTLVAALVFLAAYSVQVIGNLPPGDTDWAEYILWVSWSVFVVDYVGQLWLAPRRGRWFVHNLHELAILALPALRPFRVITFLRVMHNKAGNALRGRLLLYVIAAATTLAYCGALTVEDVEQNIPGANIRSFGDAIWWALETITTVGYGDHYPVTVVGRLVAAGLMVSGIAVLGVVTASIAAWLVETVTTRTAAEVVAEVEEDVEEVEAEVEALDTTLEARVQALAEQVARLTEALEAERADRVSHPQDG